MMIDEEPVPGPSKSTGLTISGPKLAAVSCNASVAQRFGGFGLSISSVHLSRNNRVHYTIIGTKFPLFGSSHGTA